MRRYSYDIEKLIWIERRFGITKTVGEMPSTEKLQTIESELMTILNKYREQLKIEYPLPRVRMWSTNDKLNFIFFSRVTGRRIFLGEWLSNKETLYERQ